MVKEKNEKIFVFWKNPLFCVKIKDFACCQTGFQSEIGNRKSFYSTVTLLARFRGLSTSWPRRTAATRANGSAQISNADTSKTNDPSTPSPPEKYNPPVPNGHRHRNLRHQFLIPCPKPDSHARQKRRVKKRDAILLEIVMVGRYSWDK